MKLCLIMNQLCSILKKKLSEYLEQMKINIGSNYTVDEIVLKIYDKASQRLTVTKTSAMPFLNE